MKKGEIIGRLLKDGQITEEEAVALLTGRDVDAPVVYPAVPYVPTYPYWPTTVPYWSIYPWHPYTNGATSITLDSETVTGDVVTSTVTWGPSAPFTLTGGTT